jgi:hypothetical protein
MPPGWTPKDERQKHHVEASELAAGKPPDEARSIGFATVNKRRGEVEKAKDWLERQRQRRGVGTNQYP